MSAAFGPAVWLDRAERCGYIIYLWDARGDGRLWMYTAEPNLDDGRGRHPDDDALWRDLRGDKATAAAKEKAVFDYLRKVGRIGHPAGLPWHLRPQREEAAS